MALKISDLGVQLFPGGGVQMLISIETHITCDLPGGPDQLPPPPPLDPHMELTLCYKRCGPRPDCTYSISLDLIFKPFEKFSQIFFRFSYLSATLYNFSRGQFQMNKIYNGIFYQMHRKSEL